MTRRSLSKDIIRLIKAMKDAGEQVGKVEVDQDGKVTVTTPRGEPSKEQDNHQGDWDDAISSTETRKRIS
jgi:hypothetical protein